MTRYAVAGILAVILLTYLFMKAFLYLVVGLFCTGVVVWVVGLVKLIFTVMRACTNTSLHPSSRSGTEGAPRSRKPTDKEAPWET